MVGLDLPDGNRLTFKYDEFSGLLEETDRLGKIRYEYHHLTMLVTQVRYRTAAPGSRVKEVWNAKSKKIPKTFGSGCG